MKRFLLVLLSLLGACSGEPDLSLTLTADKTNGEAPLEVNFSTRVPEGVSGVGYTWDFGTDKPGETAAGGPSRTYTFEEAGTFLVSVEATRNAQTATESIEVNVSAPPVIPGNNAPSVVLEASKKRGEAPLEVTFSAAATDPDGDAVTYSWNFGDDETAAGASEQTHTFTKAGTYTAMVTVDDARGGVAEAEQHIVVTDAPTNPAPDNRAPEVSLSANQTEGAAPLTVSFKADASDPEGDTLSYAWDFGNGKKADGNTSRTVTYTEPGSYTAVVTVGDGSSKTSANVEVNVMRATPPPTENAPPNILSVAADPPSGTTPVQVEFNVSAEDADGDPLFYVWDFGDGVISSENPAQHTYQKAGTYDASVTVGDRKGGKTSEQVTVNVTGGDPNTPDVPFYGRWVWEARKGGKTAFTGYLSISRNSLESDSSLEEFFLRGGKGAWTYCKNGLDACGAPTGVGRIDILDFGDGETFDIVFVDGKTGFEKLTAYDEDDRVDNENGAPTFQGEAVWYNDDGSSEDLSFTMTKVSNTP